jgi:hypothetical protein
MRKDIEKKENRVRFIVSSSSGSFVEVKHWGEILIDDSYLLIQFHELTLVIFAFVELDLIHFYNIDCLFLKRGQLFQLVQNISSLRIS